MQVLGNKSLGSSEYQISGENFENLAYAYKINFFFF